jgi:threonine dehydrogenase-like Zn-dependent dehydrogenase
MEQLLPLVQSKQWPFTDIITHKLPLSQGVEAYRMFDKKLDGCIKVVLDPWA